MRDHLEARPDETDPPRINSVQIVAWTNTQPGASDRGASQPQAATSDLTAAAGVGGPAGRATARMRPHRERERAIDRIYPDLPPLPVEPKLLPGPGGNPYTLADLQRMAAANSPTLRQAASDVEAAKGNLIQAKTYTNPVVAYVSIPRTIITRPNPPVASSTSPSSWAENKARSRPRPR